jgi:Amt family ammonium transporter
MPRSYALRELYHPHRQNLILKCIADSLDETNNSVDTFFLIYAASLVFYMQTGFAMLCAGSVRIKNLQNTMLKNILDACGASLGFYTVGYAFAFGGDDNIEGKTTFIGTSNFFLMGVEEKAVWLFQFSFAATSATIVAGTLAERCQMLAYLFYSTAMTAFVYPVVSHSIWNYAGFLSSYSLEPLLGSGVVDFSGCLVVHVTGGLTALIAAKVLGPRKGRFYVVDGKTIANDFPGHSTALKVRRWYIGATPDSSFAIILFQPSTVMPVPYT